MAWNSAVNQGAMVSALMELSSLLGRKTGKESFLNSVLGEGEKSILERWKNIMFLKAEIISVFRG